MEITIVTLFPQIFSSILNESILKRAQEKNLVKFNIVNIRDFATSNYKSVDDRPYGGGAGMVLRADILGSALDSVKKGERILMTPHGQTYNQQKARQLFLQEHLILICPHYEGVDQRFIEEYVDQEISLGDYILTGGEIPALVIIDSVTRLTRGVLPKQEATSFESFETFSLNGRPTTLLEYPQYTKPQVWKGKKVPEILLSGHHEQIEKWRLEEAYKVTEEKRPDLLQK